MRFDEQGSQLNIQREDRALISCVQHPRSVKRLRELFDAKKLIQLAFKVACQDLKTQTEVRTSGFLQLNDSLCIILCAVTGK